MVKSNIALDRGPERTLREGKIWGLKPSVRSDAVCRQITLAVVWECLHGYIFVIFYADIFQISYYRYLFY